MYPKVIRSSHLSLAPLKQQRGFLIPLALFIVVVMGLLALALARTTTQTGLASAQELLSLQAFYAAESGAQRGMNALYPPGNILRAEVDGRCISLSETMTFAGVPGLSSCSAQVTCVCASCALTDPTSFYTVTSIGRCGQGAIRAERIVRVGSYMDSY